MILQSVLLRMLLIPTAMIGCLRSVACGKSIQPTRDAIYTYLLYSCMEHATHLAAKHFVEGVNPTSSGKLFEKIKMAIANATTESAVDIDRLDDLDRLEKEMNGLELDGDGEEPDGDEYEVADTIGKLLALITQVNFHVYVLYMTLYLTLLFRFINCLKPVLISKNAARMWGSSPSSY